MLSLYLHLHANVDSVKSLLQDLTSGDEVRAEHAVTELAAVGEDSIPALLELANSPESDSRWWALRTLAQSPHLQTEWLIPFLKDSSPEVRQCAALGLATKPDESAIQPLVQALSDADAMVCKLAVQALIKIGTLTVPALIEAVRTAPQSARIHGMRALAEIRDQRAIPIMMQVMEEDSVLLQYWAKEGLERLGLDMVYMKPV
jgi:HEAT repeat protein